MSSTSRTAPRRIRPALLPAALGATVALAGAAGVETDWMTLVRYGVSILALIATGLLAQHRAFVWAALPVLVAVAFNPVWPLPFDTDVLRAACYLGAAVLLAVGIGARVPDPDAAKRR